MSTHSEPILILTNSITVRAYRPSDAESLAAKGNNPKIARNLTDRFPHPYTIEDANWWIQHCNDRANFLPLVLPVVARDVSPQSASLPSDYAICIDDIAIGSVGLERDQKSPRSVALGYWIDESHWGKGIATIVASEVTAWAFRTFGWLVRIDADAYSWNEASQKVLVKAGFVLEGRQRFKAYKNGKLGDLILYGKIKQDVAPDLFVDAGL